jgi:hypothetical protein
MHIETNDFPNFGYLIADLPKSTLATIVNEIQEIADFPTSATSYVDYLVADIKESYELKKSVATLNKDIQQLIKTYDQTYPGYITTFDMVSKNSPIGLSQLWVNIQKPGEVNPNHTHFGIFSFVIWLMIPYDNEEQQRDTVGAPVKGNFEFTYTQTNGQTNRISIPADKSYNGKICFFPSGMQHCVYPFTGDDNDRRITVSGNVKFLV